MKRPRMNKQLKPSGSSSRLEISNWALGPMEVETCWETAVIRKRGHEKSGVDRNDRLDRAVVMVTTTVRLT